jgi:S1-C subfamily serine protease
VGAEGALAPRSLRRRRQRRTAGAAVILAAALGGVGVGHVVLGQSPANTANTASAVLSVPQVEAKVEPALVDVVSTINYGEAEAAGTGIVLTASGEVLTNNHVVEGATSIKVTDIGNGKTYTASVVGYDASVDVAVIKLEGASGLETAALGNSSTVAVGEGVVAIGNAGGTGGTPSAATGAVTALGQAITASDEITGSDEQLANMIGTDADIQPGDSGGPLVNMSGQVVAIDTAGSSTFRFQYAGSGTTSGTDGYAIPINKALSIAKQIESGTSSSSVHIGASAFLGVEVSSTSAYSEFGSMTPGATIVGTVSGSPAAEAALAEGDTITSVGGHKVSSSSSLQHLMDQFHPGQKVIVSWVDQYGNSNKTTVTLAAGPTG